MCSPRHALVALTIAALFTASSCAAGDSPGGVGDDPSIAASATAASSAIEIGPTLELTDLLDADGRVEADTGWLIDSLDALPLGDRPPALFASVRSDVLTLSDGAGSEVSAPMPDGEFYVSIAPFETFTHECYYHSLTTCVGELRGERMHVLVTGDDDESIFDGDVTTFDNGFLGLWLPANVSGQITITADAGTVTAPISTAPDAPTCITTLELT